MAAARLLVCPRCATMIPVTPLGIALDYRPNGEAGGAVLKCCPECRDWSWMTVERQTAN